MKTLLAFIALGLLAMVNAAGTVAVGAVTGVEDWI